MICRELSLQDRPGSGDDGRPADTVELQQGLRVAGAAEAVFHADTLDRDLAVRAYDLSDCAAKTAEDVVLFRRNDRAGLLRRLPDRFAVDRLDRMQVDHTGFDSFCCEKICCF